MGQTNQSAHVSHTARRVDTAVDSGHLDVHQHDIGEVFRAAFDAGVLAAQQRVELAGERALVEHERAERIAVRELRRDPRATAV